MKIMDTPKYQKIVLEKFLGTFRSNRLRGMGYTISDNCVLKGNDVQVSLFADKSRIVIKSEYPDPIFKYIKIERQNAEAFMTFLDVFPVQIIPAGSGEILLSALEMSNFCEIQR